MSEKPAADISENIFALMKMTPESSYSFRAAKKQLKKRMPENAENMFKDDTINELNQKIKTIIEKKLKEQDVPGAIEKILKEKNDCNVVKSSWKPSGNPETDLIAHRVDAKRNLLRALRTERESQESSLKLKKMCVTQARTNLMTASKKNYTVTPLKVPLKEKNSKD